MENSNTLKNLINQRPDLDIIPFCADGCNGGYHKYEASRISDCYIGKYTENPFSDETVLFKTKEHYEWYQKKFIESMMGHDLSDNYLINVAQKAWDEMDWEEAIFVMIG